MTAFAMREGLTLGRKVTQLISGTLAVAALLFGGLSALSKSVNAPAAHGHGVAAEKVTPTVSAAQHSAADVPETAATPWKPRRPRTWSPAQRTGMRLRTATTVTDASVL
ncbi:hypothetical protein ACFSC4_28375 [Deinococcus malanensis]|uniref:hypothetical protein n=1 Tax=Deinococcus malanensis TaxID=1706855 RepID=UPI003641DD77